MRTLRVSPTQDGRGPRARPCPTAADVLTAADDDTPDVETRAIRQHLQVCPACRAALARDRQLVAVAQAAIVGMRRRRAARGVVILVAAACSASTPSAADTWLARAIARDETSAYVSVRVVPAARAAVTACPPWLGIVPAGTGLAAHLPGAAARAMVEPFGAAPLNPRVYHAWRARHAWPAASVLNVQAPQARLETVGAFGPVRRAELLLRSDTAAVIGLQLTGDTCAIAIRAVERSDRREAER